MGTLLIIFSFVFIFGNFMLSFEKKKAVFTSLRIAFIKSILVISSLVVIFTETLSFFNNLNTKNVCLLWSGVTFVSLCVLIFLFKRNGRNSNELNVIKSALLKRNGLFEKIAILFIVLILVALFFIALTPNSNWDSYTYHLPKVEHWIQDKNVDFFATNNVRQLYLAPFAEYFILNLRLLSGNAMFVNLVQFFSMVGCLILVSLIAKLFKLNYRYQIFSIVLALSLPMGLLQSTTTQTDYVAAFFLCSFVLFGMLLLIEKKFSVENILFLGIAFSLGILTKSTFYIFVFPFCLVFGIYYIKFFKFKSLYIPAGLIALFLFFNLPFLNRNFQQFGSPLGPKKEAVYYLANLNEEFGFKIMLSNFVKNISLHLVLPNEAYNSKIAYSVEELHKVIDYPLNSEKTNWFNMKYEIMFKLHHDIVGNFLQTILFFISLIIIFVKRKLVSKITILYISSLVAGYFLFAFLLKWQPWQTRLDLSLFVLMSPAIAYAFSKLKIKYLNGIVIIASIIVSLSIIFIFDPVKPVLGANSVFKKENTLFIINYDIAKKVNSELKKNKVKNVGLVLRGDTPEWQYWLMSKNVRFEYVYYHNDFTKTPNFDKNFKYKSIIVDNLYLENIEKRSRIDEFFANNQDILKVLNIDDKISLVIYKTKQDKIVTEK